MQDTLAELTSLFGRARVLSGNAVSEDDWHDESLTAQWHAPDVVVLPRSAAEVAAIVTIARAGGIPVTARGSGTGLAGACVPREGGILIALREMNAILEIDADNQVAVVQPGVTLRELNEATAAHDLVYQVFPGESIASFGGSVATNAGGMRAVKYGVTRHQVLGLEAVLGTGEVIRTGGKFVKASSGYDLTQLIVGSEGTLAIVTEATVRLHPRQAHAVTVLAPFRTVADIAGAVPRIVQSGVSPLILEYIDMMSMAGITAARGLELGIGQAVKEAASAYLVVVLESREQGRLDEDTESLGDLLTDLGALDVYVLPSGAGAALIEARERAFFAAKAAGANEIVDTVVPRAQIPEFLAKVSAIAQATGSVVIGCGHAGDGNVHLSVFQRDAGRLEEVLRSVFAASALLGGAVSGEHGIGTDKRTHFLALEEPAKLALMERIKTAFDPDGILNPGVLFEPARASAGSSTG
jgi:glycolate oxidase